METVGKSCPINGKKVNETVVRLIAGQVVLLTALSVLTGFYWITALLLVDFALRAFFQGKGSVLRITAGAIAGSLRLAPKPTDEAPKRFAASIGFSVVLSLLIIQFFEIPFAAYIIGGALIGFALLESVFAVCVGCIFYQQLTQFSWFQPKFGV